jgi:hypothetical protein
MKLGRSQAEIKVVATIKNDEAKIKTYEARIINKYFAVDSEYNHVFSLENTRQGQYRVIARTSAPT